MILDQRKVPLTSHHPFGGMECHLPHFPYLPLAHLAYESRKVPIWEVHVQSIKRFGQSGAYLGERLSWLSGLTDGQRTAGWFWTRFTQSRPKQGPIDFAHWFGRQNLMQSSGAKYPLPLLCWAPIDHPCRSASRGPLIRTAV